MFRAFRLGVFARQTPEGLLSFPELKMHGNPTNALQLLSK
jgi:hypothetical protein